MKKNKRGRRVRNLLLLWLYMLVGLPLSAGFVNTQTVVSLEKRKTIELIKSKEIAFKSAVDDYVKKLETKKKVCIEELRLVSSLVLLSKRRLLEKEAVAHNIGKSSQVSSLQTSGKIIKR